MGKKAGVALGRDLSPWSAFSLVRTTSPQTFQLFSEAPAVTCSYCQANAEHLACFRKSSDDPWTTHQGTSPLRGVQMRGAGSQVTPQTRPARLEQVQRENHLDKGSEKADLSPNSSKTRAEGP